MAHWDMYKRNAEMSWSPCSTRLRLQARLRMQDESRGGSNLEIFEAATGRDVTPAWSPAAAAVLAHKGHCAWSPDGSMLLYSLQAVHRVQDMHLLHVVQGTLLASVKLEGRACSHPTCPVSRDFGHALWHPSSKGLVLPGCSWTVMDPQLLYRLGLKVGYCPASAHLSLRESSFSPCGRSLLVRESPTRGPEQVPPAWEGAFCRQLVSVIRCSPGQHHYEFDTEYTWGAGPREQPLLCRWCPMSPALLQQRVMGSEAEVEAGAAAVLVSSEAKVWPAATNGVCLGKDSLPGFRAWPETESSPCGEFCTIQPSSGLRGTRIWHTRSGACYSFSRGARELFLPASGDCIVQWHDSPGYNAKGWPFTVLRFAAPKQQMKREKKR